MEIKLTATDPKFKVGDLVFNRMTHRNFVVSWIDVEMNFSIGGPHQDRVRFSYSYCGKDERQGYHVEDAQEDHLVLASENTFPSGSVTVNDGVR